MHPLHCHRGESPSLIAIANILPPPSLRSSQYLCDEAFESSMTAREKKDLARNRTLMCLTTMYVRNLSTSSVGRRLIIDCEADMIAAKELGDDGMDDGTATISTVNYSLAEDEVTVDSGEKKDKPEYQPPALFTGIINWSIVEVRP